MPNSRKYIPKGYRRVRLGEMIPAGKQYLVKIYGLGVEERVKNYNYRQIRNGAVRFIKK